MRMNDVIGRKQFRFLSHSIHTGHASKKIDKRLNKNKVPREPPVNMSSKSSPVKLNKPELVLKQWCQQFVTPFQKPWTQSNVLYHYIPLFGAIDYHILALNVLNPKLLINLGRSVGINVNLTNLLLFGSISGGTLHLYNRKLMGGLTLSHRALYSAYFGSLTVFGSVLTWAIASRIVPSNPLFRTLLALGSAWSMLKIQLSFCDHLDKHR